MNEYETFPAEVTISGNSKVIIIPYNIVKFGGYEKGNKVKILIKKLEE